MSSSLHINAGMPEVASMANEHRMSVVHAKPKNAMTAFNDYVARFTPIKAREKASFFRLLATMINAGIPIVKSLKILADQIENVRLKQIVDELSQRIEQGKSLSRAMMEYRQYFSDAQVGMVESGEASGRLNQILLQIASETERSANLRSKVRGAMIYPIVVIVLLIAAGIAVMTFVMPKIKEVFDSLGGELPVTTQFLIKTSDFMVSSTMGVSNVLWGIGGFIGAVVAFNFWRKTASGAILWSKILLATPIFGSLFQKLALAQFCQSMAILTSSGLSIIKVLRITSDSVANPIYKKRILKIADDVVQGIPMGDNLKGDPLFPSMVVGMISVAEQTAQLDVISQKLADFYEEEVSDMIKNLSSLMEPLIIVVLGGAVGFLVISVMLPILQSSDLAANA